MGNNTIPLKIAGVGYSIPDTVITNDDLTKLYDTSDEWIYSRTGIKERRVVSGCLLYTSYYDYRSASKST